MCSFTTELQAGSFEVYQALNCANNTEITRPFILHLGHRHTRACVCIITECLCGCVSCSV